MAVQTTPARRPSAATTRSDSSADRNSVDCTDGGAADGGATGSGVTLERAIGWLLVALGFLVGSRVIFDNSFFTHLATGTVILDERAVPTADVFSFTAAGEPWTVQSWFASVFYRSLYEFGGLGLVRIANGLIVAALVSALWRLTAPAKLLLPRVLLGGTTLLIGAIMWSPRPLLFGLLCFALAIEIIENERRPLWALLPVMWLWVNTHGSFPLVFLFIGAIGVGQLLDDRTFHRRDLQAGAWLVGGTALGALNPVGVKLLTFPFELLTKREALEDVVEWMPPEWTRPSEWGFLVLALVLLAAAKSGARWRHLLPAFGFFVTGLLAVRNINPAAVVMVACAAPALASWPGALDGATRSVASRGVALLSAAVFAIGVAYVAITPGIDYETYPVLEVDWLAERDLVAEPDVNLIHRDTTGNYLELRFGDDARVFMDDRYDMYPQTVIDDHAELYFGGDFAGILARYDADAVLWESSGDFADWLRSDESRWQVTVDGDDWINPPGFATAYHEYRRTSPDVLLCDYREHDETNKNIKEPADSVRWLDIVKGVGHVPDTELALPMIAVPWRKFYRRDFIEEHQLRFPECDSFYEDNPFHWDVCLSADDIAFVRTIVCFHRVNRPGQTMGANGLELLAFFDHYERILHIVRAKGPAFEAEATIWLLNQMSWTRQRVAPSFMPAYADAAARALGACDARVWDERVEPWLTGKAIHAPARLVRAGDTLSFVAWSQNERMRDQMRDLSSGLHSLRAPSAHTEDHRIAALAQKIDRIDLAVTKIENYQHASWILGAENSLSTHHELRTATTEEVSDV